MCARESEVGRLSVSEAVLTYRLEATGLEEGIVCVACVCGFLVGLAVYCVSVIEVGLGCVSSLWPSGDELIGLLRCR